MAKNQPENERPRGGQTVGAGVQSGVRDGEVIPSVPELEALDFDSRAEWVKVIKDTPAFFDQTKALSDIYEATYRPFVERHEREQLLKKHAQALSKGGTGVAL